MHETLKHELDIKVKIYFDVTKKKYQCDQDGFFLILYKLINFRVKNCLKLRRRRNSPEKLYPCLTMS